MTQKLEEMEKKGHYIAEVLNLRKTGKRYKTAWGVKTGLGVYNTFITLAKSIKIIPENWEEL